MSVKKFFIVPLFLLFCNFGKFVHTLINTNVIEMCGNNKKFNDIFTKDMKSGFINRAAEPDERKRKDYSEKCKHFFHYNVYSPSLLKNFITLDEFIEALKMDFEKNVDISFVGKKIDIKKIPQFVKSHGQLPWAIIETINKLKKLVKDRDSLYERMSNINKSINDSKSNLNEIKKLEEEINLAIVDCNKNILYECINLSHYIADLYTPLHLNIYYDGKYYLQTGIHHFWETSLPVHCKGDYKIEYIDLNNEINKVGLGNFILKTMKDSYKLSDKILEDEANIVFDDYKRSKSDIYYEKRFFKKDYKIVANKYFHAGTTKQISLAVSFISYIFNKLIFV